MAERTWYWGGTSVGDAALAAPYGAPYTDTMWSDNWSKMFLYDRTIQGVIPTARTGYTGMLGVTDAGGGHVTVGTGIALVDGRLYENDAAIDVNLSAADGIYYIILRRVTATQTVRLTTTQAALVQNSTTWEIPLAEVSISAGVVAILNDLRSYITMGMGSGMVEIISTTVPYGGGTINWTNIPQIFSSLMIVGTGKILAYGGGVASASIATAFNADGNVNNYSSYATSSSWTGAPPRTDVDSYYAAGTQAYIPLGAFPPGTGGNPGQTVLAIRGTVRAYIFDYSSTTAYKNIEGYGVARNSAFNGSEYTGGQYLSVSPITSIQMQSDRNTTVGNYDFEAGSHFSLFGIL